MLRMFHRVTMALSHGIWDGSEFLSELFPTSAKRPNGTYAAPGFMGVFGNGEFLEYDQPGTFTFTVPEGVTVLRLRTQGRGSVGGFTPGYYTGTGSGGGYAHGAFMVTPGEILTIKIPSFRYNNFTETSIVSNLRGLLIRATNGGAYNAPGQGYGGAFQSKGGTTGATSNGLHYGTGAGGTQIALQAGSGTVSMYASDVAGGGVGGGANKSMAGGAAGNAPATNIQGPGVSLSGLILPEGFPRFKLDGFWGAGGSGQPGAGGVPSAPIGGVCAGWTATSTVTDASKIYGAAPTTNFASNKYYGGTADALGMAVIEW